MENKKISRSWRVMHKLENRKTLIMMSDCSRHETHCTTKCQMQSEAVNEKKQWKKQSHKSSKKLYVQSTLLYLEHAVVRVRCKEFQFACITTIFSLLSWFQLNPWFFSSSFFFSLFAARWHDANRFIVSKFKINVRAICEFTRYRRWFIQT